MGAAVGPRTNRVEKRRRPCIGMVPAPHSNSRSLTKRQPFPRCRLLLPYSTWENAIGCEKSKKRLLSWAIDSIGGDESHNALLMGLIPLGHR